MSFNDFNAGYSMGYSDALMGRSYRPKERYLEYKSGLPLSTYQPPKVDILPKLDPIYKYEPLKVDFTPKVDLLPKLDPILDCRPKFDPISKYEPLKVDLMPKVDLLPKLNPVLDYRPKYDPLHTESFTQFNKPKKSWEF